MQRVFLVPGFFGFVNLGDMRYFGHVHRYLVERFAEAGIEAAVHEVDTLPTASLERRAARLLERLEARVRPGDDVHLIGHSSGGIDARLLTSPGARIGPDPVAAASVLQHIRSVVTVASPNRGTPSAQSFDSLAGQQLLRLISVMTAVLIRRGSLPLGLLLRVGKRVARLENHLDEGELGIEDELFESLLGELDDERRSAIAGFFRDVGADRALLAQITPDAMDLFNAMSSDAPGIRYGSVVTRALRPGLRGFWNAGPSPVAQASHSLYLACHRLARLRSAAGLGPVIEALRARWPELDHEDNDGMVPTASQPWGELITTADADHLDVIGHFTGPGRVPPHYDWIRTGTGFDRAGFERTWDAVFGYLTP